MNLTKEAPTTTGFEGQSWAGRAPAIPVPWEALGSDAGIFVMLVDATGNVVFANTAWNRLLGLSQVTGKTLIELLGKEIAAERQQINDRVIATKHPESILDMVGGSLLRTTRRPIQSPEDGIPSGVLVTSCVVREGMELSNIRLATYHDLGHLQALTEREFELLHHVGKGLSSDDAATKMHRSTRTVEWHRASLGEKLGCHNRVEIARVAIASGITAVSVEMLLKIHRAAKPRRA
ncbi:MAG: LuxR C-terminal-related transcriptional regulator [Phycisphaerales bacterium]|jgi:DNA-binding CsgD family transcriptional regulator